MEMRQNDIKNKCEILLSKQQYNESVKVSRFRYVRGY